MFFGGHGLNPLSEIELHQLLKLTADQLQVNFVTWNNIQKSLI